MEKLVYYLLIMAQWVWSEKEVPQVTPHVEMSDQLLIVINLFRTNGS